MAPIYLFEIPAALQAAVQNGISKQVGALITNPSTGRIVAHLQQTGAARDLAMTLVQNAPANWSNWKPYANRWMTLG